jgi:hypothetical protein
MNMRGHLAILRMSKWFLKLKLGAPMKFLKLTMALASLAMTVIGPAHGAASEVTPDEARKIAREAYVYGFSPVYAYRYLQDEVFNQRSPSYIGAFNKIRNYQRLNTPEDTMITPNVDAPYTRVWLDLRAEPIVVTLPKITPKNRYYVMQAISLDHYNIDFTGTRTIGQDGGPIVYVGPRHSGPIPKGVGRVVQSPTDFVYLQGRILVFNPADMKNVVALQDGIKLKTLSETLGQPKPKAAENFQLKPWTTDDEALRSVKTLDYLAYVLQFISLQAPEEQRLRERFAKIGIVAGKPFSMDGQSPEIKSAIEAGVAAGVGDVKSAINSATSSAGLLGSKEELGDNYLNRAAGVGAGIFGNSPAEAIYVGATMTSAKAGQKYVLTFPPGQLPPVEKEGFWSITMYNIPERLLIHNPIERYALGNRSPGLKRNNDGGLSIYLQPESPGKDKEGNWLPTPPEGPFFYVVRLYLPAKSAQDGTWKDPKPVLAQ